MLTPCLSFRPKWRNLGFTFDFVFNVHCTFRTAQLYFIKKRKAFFWVPGSLTQWCQVAFSLVFQGWKSGKLNVESRKSKERSLHVGRNDSQAITKAKYFRFNHHYIILRKEIDIFCQTWVLSV